MQTDERYQMDGANATAVNVVAIAAAEDVAMRGYTTEKISAAINQGEYVVLHCRVLEAARKAPKGTTLGDIFFQDVIAEWLKIRGQVSMGPSSHAAVSSNQPDGNSQ